MFRFLRHNSSVVLADCEFRLRFPGHPRLSGQTPRLSGQTQRRLAARLEEYETTRVAENIAVVAEDVAEDSGVSTRQHDMHLKSIGSLESMRV